MVAGNFCRFFLSFELLVFLPRMISVDRDFDCVPLFLLRQLKFVMRDLDLLLPLRKDKYIKKGSPVETFHSL